LGGCNTNIVTRSVNDASQQQAENSVMIYPNPAHENISIKLSTLQQGVMVVVFDANGKIVLSERMTNSAKTFSVKSLASGVYYVQVRNGKNITTQKIVKQ
jgi:uncharacterized protein (DUF2249 family)